MKLTRKISLIISYATVILLVLIDQLTKYLAVTNEHLLNGETIMVIKYIISFKLAFNKGAAWSILEGQTFILVSISVIASLAVAFLIFKLVDFKKAPLLSIALILIDAGAIGNLIDRAFYEKGVIDFLNFEFMEFPTFNFADSCLTIGAVVLMVYIVFFYKEPPKDKPQSEEGGVSSNA